MATGKRHMTDRDQPASEAEPASLQARLEDKTKRWKFQHGDIEERKLWDDYQKAYEDALEKTSTDYAPWTVVPANKKWIRNYVVANSIVKALDTLEMKYPQPDLSAEIID